MPQDHETLVDSSTNVVQDAPTSLPCLTILYHPDLRRIGQQAPISQLSEGKPVAISRLTPVFAVPGGRPRALDDPYISRREVELRLASGSILITPPQGVNVVVDGAELTEPHAVPESALQHGITLQLGRRVALFLHLLDISEHPPRFGLIGDSDAIWEVRREIARAAKTDSAVLIHGETGVGKELVARSIHDASARAGGPWVSVNMAALTPSTALSELFGHERAAFTGAGGRYLGLFEQADGGTLFLDEVGDTPQDVQGMLLRTLQEGTIRRMGDSTPERKVDVRVLSATDADLTSDGFRDQLRYRLAVLSIRVPPLRARRDDIPRLVVHFLREELSRLGQLHLLSASAKARKPWFPLGLMMRLFGYQWRGNVRELYNAVVTIVAAGQDIEAMSSRVLDERMPELVRSRHPRPDTAPADSLGPEPPETTPPDGVPELGPSAESSPTEQDHAGVETGRTEALRPRVTRAGTISDDELEQLMVACRYSVGKTAAHLGIPRSTLYGLLKHHPTLRIAGDVTYEEYLRCYRACGGDLDRMVEELRVSKRGIALQLRQFKITGDDD